ncbi:MAG: hypothetical protein LBF87_05090 [Treponema sp.]|jgi:hypothetical protein|nr:hypothetical protein [Treponema sp.]
MPNVWTEVNKLNDPREDGEEFFSMKDIAAQYGLDIGQVRRWAIAHTLPYVMQTGSPEYLWDEEAVVKLYSEIGQRG